MIVQTGATPVFVEPDPDTFNIDPTKIEEVLTKKTKAIEIVHMYGLPCDMDPIREIAEKSEREVCRLMNRRVVLRRSGEKGRG